MVDVLWNQPHEGKEKANISFMDLNFFLRRGKPTVNISPWGFLSQLFCLLHASVFHRDPYQNFSPGIFFCSSRKCGKLYKSYSVWIKATGKKSLPIKSKNVNGKSWSTKSFWTRTTESIKPWIWLRCLVFKCQEPNLTSLYVLKCPESKDDG